MTEIIAGVRIYDILILLLIFALPAVIRTAVEAFRRKKYETTVYYAQTALPYRALVRDKGRLGEYYTFMHLRNLGGYKKFLFNCYVPKSDEKTTEIDVIMLHETGIYVFESKNYSGWIFGSADGKYWTQSLNAGGRAEKHKFYNPVFQNNNHIKWLKTFLADYGEKPFVSYIVFSDRCRFMDIKLTSRDQFVMHRKDAAADVAARAKKAEAVLTAEQIDDIFNRLYPLTQVSDEKKAEHIERIEEMKNGAKIPVPAAESAAAAAVCETDAESPESAQRNTICPQCGGKLILKTAKRGERSGKSFLGCENFPKCRYIENIE